MIQIIIQQTVGKRLKETFSIISNSSNSRFSQETTSRISTLITQSTFLEWEAVSTMAPWGLNQIPVIKSSLMRRQYQVSGEFRQEMKRAVIEQVSRTSRLTKLSHFQNRVRLIIV